MRRLHDGGCRGIAWSDYALATRCFACPRRLDIERRLWFDVRMKGLLERCLQGDSDAWDAFVDRFAPVIYGAVRRVVLARVQNDPSISIEDIAQEVFVRLLRRDAQVLRSHDASRASLATWLTIIARSTALDALRKRKLATVPIEAGLDAQREQVPEGPPPTSRIPPGLLSPRQALVLHLLFDEQLDVSEIARILGIAEQTVRSAKHKSLEKLRHHFATDRD